MAQLKDIIKAAVKRDGKTSGGETLLVANHLRQMQQWMIRQGVSFFPKQDNKDRARRKKIEEIIEFNRLELYYYGITALYLTSGSILWYLRPTGSEAYEIHWYQGGDPSDPETGYKAYFKPGGRELDEVIIRYSYEDYSPQAVVNQGHGLDRKKWIRLRIRADWIVEEHYSVIPSLYPDNSALPTQHQWMGAPFKRDVQQNSLGFIPCVVSSNHPFFPGDQGTGEFDWLKNPIEAEDAMRSSMLDNVFMFGNASLVTTRPASQIVEAMSSLDGSVQRPSWASQNGYASAMQGVSRKSDPWVRGNRYGEGGDWSSKRSHVARVIGNVLPEERFGYIFPDPINGDQWRFTQEYREGIHEALGGIDPLGTKSGMTFGEVKSLHGKVAATANQKCLGLFTHGLCKLLEMVILIEEQIFIQGYKQYLITQHPKKKVFLGLLEKEGDISVDLVMQDLVDNEMLVPPGVSGLIPYGDRTVKWKWTGPVFETQARDLLDTSIVVRNMQELGVGSLQAMAYLFPDKEPQELESMLTGVPFRFGQSVTQWLAALLGLQQQLSAIPDPYDPTMPMSARIDLTPVIQQQLLSLVKETSYGESYEPASNLASPSFAGSSGVFGATGNTSGDFTAGQPQLPTTNGIPSTGVSGNGTPTGSAVVSQQRGAVSPSNSGYAAGLQPTYPSPVQQPIYPINGTGLGGNDQGFSLRPEWQSPLPNSGASTLGSTAPVPTQLPTNGWANIPPDLYSATGQLSGLAQQLYGSQLPISGQRGSPNANGRRSKGKSKRSGNK
jgi:hypothetical protein